MPLSGVRASALAFWTAAATLFAQVLLHRVVSAKLLNNYAFLVISLTMLGFAVSGVVCRLMTPCHFLLRSQRGSVSEMAWSSWNAVQMWWVRSKCAMPFSMAVLSSKRVRKIRSTWGFFFTPRLCKHPIREASAAAVPHG